MKKTISKKKKTSKKYLRAKSVAFRMAIVSSRGQLTIPQDIRTFMHIREGSAVGFEPTKKGILMRPLKVEPEDPYSAGEWVKIEKLSKSKGEVYKNAEEAKKYIADL